MKLLKSFRYAIEGLVSVFKSEMNFKIHFVIAIGVICAGLYFKLSKLEWAFIIQCIAMVLCAELFNTAIEKLCNKVQPNIDPQIKWIKDVSAAAVLITAIAAAITGIIIFTHHFF
ncbi:MAG: diacylglycerol kinase family protein [Chitinophagaceae bacterium]|nr:diacylglycerol kinase family protein [Chitinophagaceae bacterium]